MRGIRNSVTTQGRTNAMARISTTVPTTVYDALGRLAALQGRSMSNLVAYVMERYIEEMRANSVSDVPDDKAA